MNKFEIISFFHLNFYSLDFYFQFQIEGYYCYLASDIFTIENPWFH